MFANSHDMVAGVKNLWDGIRGWNSNYLKTRFLLSRFQQFRTSKHNWTKYDNFSLCLRNFSRQWLLTLWNQKCDRAWWRYEEIHGCSIHFKIKWWKTILNSWRSKMFRKRFSRKRISNFWKVSKLGMAFDLPRSGWKSRINWWKSIQQR